MRASHYRRIWQIGCVLVLAGSATGCPLLSDDCTTILIPAINVTVTDSVSGAAIADGVTAIAVRNGTDSSVVNTAGFANHATISLGDAAGTFSVTLTRAGYLTWTMSNIVVPANGCHPMTVSLQARLRPNPPPALDQNQ